ncbi:MAG TPA: response regulator [Mucilaginibacter sp.]|jgi:CheY-like chemotaxis protein|nr:response regulator [Mucilaginibacter sp.]
MRLSFIVVEHSEIDIYIATELARRFFGDAVVETFLSAEAALDHIVLNKAPEADRHLILLDLMIPGMDGANFISLFEALPRRTRDNYRIVIVTSSMNKVDLERLRKRRDVEMIIEKPLTSDKFRSILVQLNIPVD